MGLGTHCRQVYFTTAPKKASCPHVPGGGTNLWYREGLKAFDEADIVGIDVTEALQFLKLTSDHVPQNLSQLCDFACRQMQRQVHAAAARNASQLVVVMLDGRRRAMMKDVEAARRRQGKARLDVTAMEGDPSGKDDMTGTEYALPWHMLTPPDPKGKDAERAYSSLNVMGRIRRFTARTLHNEGPYKLRLDRQTQRLLVVADGHSASDSVTYWCYDKAAGRWHKENMGGMRDEESCDGEADVLWPLILTQILQQRQLFGIPTEELHVATFSVDTDWVAIGAIWLAARRVTLQKGADAKVMLRWNKRSVQGKLKGMLSCFDIHTLVDQMLADAGERGATKPLEVVANEILGWISVAGCDFVKQADMRKGKKLGFAQLAREVTRKNALKIMQVAATPAMLDDSHQEGEQFEVRTAYRMTLSLVLTLKHHKVLEFTNSLQSKKTALPTQYAIAQSGGRVAIRNAATTVAYWLAAAIGGAALRSVVPYKVNVPVHQVLMSGFAPQDYKREAESESDEGVGRNKRRVLRWATEEEVSDDDVPRASWVLPLA